MFVKSFTSIPVLMTRPVVSVLPASRSPPSAAADPIYPTPDEPSTEAESDPPAAKLTTTEPVNVNGSPT